jgi:hypothetical protein
MARNGPAATACMRGDCELWPRTEIVTCTHFKANQRLLIIATEAHPIPLLKSPHYRLSNKTIIMIKEQLGREINEHQPELVTEVSVHEQNANDMVHSVF